MADPIDSDFEVTIDRLEDDSKTLLIQAYPSWSPDEIQLQILSGGYVNSMVQCYTEKQPHLKLIIRTYSNLIEDVFVDRKRELACVKALSTNGCFPQLVIVFKNGYCYKSYEGETLFTNLSYLAEDTGISALAKGFVKIHCTEIPERKKESKVFPELRTFLKQAKIKNFDKIRETAPELPLPAELEKEIDILEEEINKLNYPIVLTHGDSHGRNILWNLKDDHVVFVDCEMTDYNYQPWDIAYHIVSYEFDVFEANSNTLPFDLNVFSWKLIECYLKNWFEATGRKASQVTDRDIKHMWVSVKKLSLLIQFNMVVLVGAMSNNLDKLDIHKFAGTSYNWYLKMKEEYLSLKLPD